MSNNIKKYNYFDHLAELKKRLTIIFIIFIIFFAIFFYFSDFLYSILLHPLSKVYQAQDRNLSLIYTALPEAFMAHIKISVFTAIFLTLPLAFLQIYRFISPAFYQNERIIFRIIFISSPFLFFLGGFIAYFFVIPVAYKFFLGFEVTQNNNQLIAMLPKVSEYLSISIKIILAFSICFQIPVILFTLLSLRIIQLETLKKFRKYMIVISFILSAFFTPPDPLSQVMLAFSLIFLYEISIILFKIVNKKKQLEN